VTSEEAFQLARHRGRYAHYDSVVFKNAAGEWFCERYSREAIKRAMLAVGTAGKFYIEGGAHPHIVRWRQACVRLRSARFLEVAA